MNSHIFVLVARAAYSIKWRWAMSHRHFLFVPLVLLISGCVTKGNVQDVMLPYPIVYKTVVKNLPGGMRQQSQNGRELTSEYFSAKTLDVDPASDEIVGSLERSYAIVTILGSSRPYTLDVRVIRERRARGSNQFSQVGMDKRLTKELADRLQEALADRREGGNIIDDFRAF